MGESQMSRKNNAILAIGALAAFGFASSAFAQCPDSPTPPWSGAPTFQGALAIAEGGLADTSCHLNSTINNGAGGAAFATVQDDTPEAEPRYRAQFVINADSLTNQSLLAGVTVFTASSEDNGIGVRFTVFGNGSGGRTLGYFVQDGDQPSGVNSGSAALVAGENTIEFDLPVGDASQFRLWVNNGDEAAATAQRTVNNSAFVGVDTAFLGLAAPTPQYVTAHGGTAVQFDEFDSRRSSFIGL
jgi:hypothetical protein